MRTKRRVLKDICLCGHGRAHHLDRFGPCDVCKQSYASGGPFMSTPGTCDRFTWDPDQEEK